jgi:tRNA ligase
MDAAIEVALGYRPDPKHVIASQPDPRKQAGKQGGKQAQKPTKQQPLEYVGVDVARNDIINTLEKAFKGKGPEVTRFWTQLNKMGRVQPKFHVTLMHRASASQNNDLWDKYQFLHKQAVAKEGSDGRLGECDVQLERVVFDDRIMAIVVRLITKQDDDQYWECINQVAHVTVGTRDANIKPKESNDLLGKWLNDGASPENKIQQVVFDEQPVLSGVVKGVLSR